MYECLFTSQSRAKTFCCSGRNLLFDAPFFVVVAFHCLVYDVDAGNTATSLCLLLHGRYVLRSICLDTYIVRRHVQVTSANRSTFYEFLHVKNYRNVD